MTKIAVLGTGMAGCGAAYRLQDEGADVVLYDKNPYPGGHTVSLTYEEGFTFDIGPHVSFTSDPRIQEIFAEAVDGAFDSREYRFTNYWEGCWLGHPAQTNLYGLPPQVIVKVISDFVAESASEREIHNYEDWLQVAYGKTFAEWFPGRYTYKYHTTEAANLTTDWMGPRMYRPSLEEMLLGAITRSSPNVHYIRQFRYPRSGGFSSYVKGLAAPHDVRLNHEVVGIDPEAKELTFSDGRQTSYDALISSIPLPEVVKLVRGVPDDVLRAAEQLACSSCVLVNIGIDRPDIADVQISYFYDLDIIFPRASFPHMMAESTVPEGCSSVQVEIYFSQKYRPFSGSPSDLIEPTVRDLIRCGVLREGDRILMKDAVFVPYANIIFDHDRASALARVQGFLDDAGIRSCGRFGEWAYYWTDDSFKSGERAAERALGDTG
jgi:protoporphyrinogen oxidase